MQIHFDLLQCENKSGEYPTSSGLNAMEAREAKSQRRKEEKKTGAIVLSVLPMTLGGMR